MVTVLEEAKPRVKNIMTLGSCAAIVGAEVSALGVPGAAALVPLFCEAKRYWQQYNVPCTSPLC
jgi:hypothetical protein